MTAPRLDLPAGRDVEGVLTIRQARRTEAQFLKQQLRTDLLLFPREYTPISCTMLFICPLQVFKTPAYPARRAGGMPTQPWNTHGSLTLAGVGMSNGASHTNYLHTHAR